MINILCYGDSNTYGYIPGGNGRFDENIRWTGKLSKALEKKCHIIEEGLCGRTTVFEDALREGRRGADLIGTIIESHNPIDILIIMLGTNDCKTRYGASAGTIAKGMEEVINRAYSKATTDMKVLLISPILLGEGVGDYGFDPEFDLQSEATSKQLAKTYESLAQKKDTTFLMHQNMRHPAKRTGNTLMKRDIKSLLMQ